MKLVPYRQPESQERQLVSVEEGAISLAGMPAHVSSVYGKPQAVDVLSYVDILRRRWMWIVGSLIVVLSLGYVNTKLQQPRYAASAEIAVRDQLYQPIKSGEEVAVMEKIRTTAPTVSIASMVRLLQSSEVIQAAMEAIPEEIRRAGFPGGPGIEVEQPEELGKPMAVTVTALAPEAAAQLANNLVKELIERDLAESQKITATGIQYVEAQLEEVSRDLHTARQQLATFKATHGTTGSSDILDSNIKELSDLKRDADQAARDFAVANSNVISLRNRLNRAPKYTLSDIVERPNPELERTDARITELETQRREQLAIYTPDAPEIRRLERQIEDLQRYRATLQPIKPATQTHIVNPAYRQLEEQYLNAVSNANIMRVKLNTLKRSINEKTRQINAMSPHETKSAELEMRVTTLENTYARLSSDYESLSINKESAISNVRILSLAQPNPHPVSPNLARNMVLALALGILLAIIITLTLEAMDNRIHSERSLELVVMRLALAQIPRMAEPGMKLAALSDGSNGPILEQMRILRNNLSIAMQANQRIIAVTSPGIGEGKSTTSFNLAVTMSLDGRRVILIDADLRSPRLHTYLGLRNEKGLTNVFNGTATLEEVLITTPIAGVTFLPAGPTVINSPEVLHAAKTHQLIRDLAEQYDVVIVDTPPAVGLSDVLSLVPVVDGFLIVVSATRTNRDDLRLTTQLLEQSGAPILGFVYNQASLSKQVYRNYEHYHRRETDQA